MRRTPATRARARCRAAAWLLPLLGALAAGCGESRLSEPEECTIAVVAGSATPDGRPLLWKSRDAEEWFNEVACFEENGWAHIALACVADTINARLGVNERGFAIVNATALNLPDTLDAGITNGALMKRALRECATLDDFERLLILTGIEGRAHPSSMGVIDAEGGAAIYEVGNHGFVAFDATDPEVAPDGFLVRANFGLSGDTTAVSKTRYERASVLLSDAAAEDRLDLAALLDASRDLWTPAVDPYPLPCDRGPPQAPHAIGYVDAYDTINRSKTVAFGVIQGVAPGEDPRLATFYAAPGHPVVTPVTPVWVAAGPTPPELDGPLGSPICNVAYERRLDSYPHPIWRWWIHTNYLVHTGGEDGFLVRVQAIEGWVLPQTAAHLEHWRTGGVDPAEMAAVERQIAAAAFAEYAAPVPEPASAPPASAGSGAPALAFSPNPARGAVRIAWAAPPPHGGEIVVSILDVSGRRVRRIFLPPSGAVWDGRNDRGEKVAPGIYLVRPIGVRREAAGVVCLLP